MVNLKWIPNELDSILTLKRPIAANRYRAGSAGTLWGSDSQLCRSQTCWWIPKMAIGILSQGSGPKIMWDHKSTYAIFTRDLI